MLYECKYYKFRSLRKFKRLSFDRYWDDVKFHELENELFAVLKLHNTYLIGRKILKCFMNMIETYILYLYLWFIDGLFLSFLGEF